MKHQVLAFTLVACVAVALVAPSVSPAGGSKTGPKSGQASPPKKSNKAPPPPKKAAPQPPTTAPPQTPAAATPTPSLNGNMAIRAPALRQVQRFGTLQIQPTPAQIADQDVCLFQNANFDGWKFCTNLKGLQALPTRYVRQATSMTVPDGYLLRLYQRADRSGTQCVFYGQVGAVSPECDNMTAAISFEPDPEWPAKQAAAQRARELAEAEAARQQQRAEREAEAARIVAQEQAERDATLAQARQIIERDRQAQAQREAEAQAQSQSQAQDTQSANLGPYVPECAVLVSESDGGILSDVSGAATQCYNVNVGMTYVGGRLNDDIERIEVRSRWVVFIGYEDANFQGRSIRLTCGTYELIGEPENEISSVKIEMLPRAAACGNTAPKPITRWQY
jgi:hypothetical protein